MQLPIQEFPNRSSSLASHMKICANVSGFFIGSASTSIGRLSSCKSSTYFTSGAGELSLRCSKDAINMPIDTPLTHNTNWKLLIMSMLNVYRFGWWWCERDWYKLREPSTLFGRAIFVTLRPDSFSHPHFTLAVSLERKWNRLEWNFIVFSHFRVPLRHDTHGSLSSKWQGLTQFRRMKSYQILTISLRKKIGISKALSNILVPRDTSSSMIFAVGLEIHVASSVTQCCRALVIHVNPNDFTSYCFAFYKYIDNLFHHRDDRCKTRREIKIFSAMRCLCGILLSFIHLLLHSASIRYLDDFFLLHGQGCWDSLPRMY